MARELSQDVDGFTVDQFAATFQGVAEIEIPDARYMTYDDDLLVVVRVRVKMPRLKEARNGDITRVNVLGVKELALVRSEKLRDHLCETLGLERPLDLNQQQLPLHELIDDVPSTNVETFVSGLDTEDLKHADDQPKVVVGDLDFTPDQVFSPGSNGDSGGPKTVPYGPDHSGSKERGNKALASWLSEV